MGSKTSFFLGGGGDCAIDISSLGDRNSYKTWPSISKSSINEQFHVERNFNKQSTSSLENNQQIFRFTLKKQQLRII